jgi:large subunit ribosomal protein L10
MTLATLGKSECGLRPHRRRPLFDIFFSIIHDPMPPRLPLSARQLRSLSCKHNGQVIVPCRYASIATTPAPPIHEEIEVAPPIIQRFPPTQPPSHKLPDMRKSQLHRQYQSLLKSTPLMLIFQHNNLTSAELNGIRRELAAALRKVDEAEGTALSNFVKLQVIQTGIFASALQVVESYEPSRPVKHSKAPPTELPESKHRKEGSSIPDKSDPQFTHGLSVQAYQTAKAARKYGKQHSELAPLLKGPLVLLTFPTVSPAYLRAALTIISPSGRFPAPKRRANPTYHEPAVQSGIHKLMLLGARAEGRVFDTEGARWIGGIEGGLTGLRSQLVALLQQFGMGVTNTLEAASKSLYFSLENRRGMLEEEENPKPKDEQASQ